MRRATVSVVLVAALLAPATAQDDGKEKTRIARLAGLCRAWGTVKFFHPWIVTRDVDWDAALVEAIPLVDAAKTADDYRAAVDRMLVAMGDPFTRCLAPSPTERPKADPSAQPTLTWIESGKGGRTAVISATDWRGVAARPDAPKGGLFAAVFARCGDAAGVVLDLRRWSPAPRDCEDDVDAMAVAALLQADVPALLPSAAPMPSARERIHSGYAPQRGTSSGGYWSGFETRDHATVPAGRGAASGKPLVVLTNAAVRGVDLLHALQSVGRAVVVHEGAAPALFDDGDASCIDLPDGVRVRVRTGDLIGADGSCGFEPAVRVEKSDDAATDAAMERALAIVRGEVRVDRPLPRPAFGGVTPPDRSYADTPFPDRAHRLLGLFRLWTVIHLFDPYEHLMDRPWDGALAEFVPRFETVLDADDYPRGTAWEICARLTDKPFTMATFRRVVRSGAYPEGRASYLFEQPIEPSPLPRYAGRIVVLIDENAVSQSEHSCLGFEGAAKGRIQFVGTPTVGANGDVTNLCLPGDLWVSFSGHDVRHADGRQLQRVGIRPDVRVEPTVEGLVAGRDEVLEAAVKLLAGN